MKGRVPTFGALYHIISLLMAYKYLSLFKVIGIRPMAPLLNKVHLKVSEQEMLRFSVRREIIKYDNSLVVILLSKILENEFLQTL